MPTAGGHLATATPPPPAKKGKKGKKGGAAEETVSVQARLQELGPRFTLKLMVRPRRPRAPHLQWQRLLSLTSARIVDWKRGR